MSNYIAKAYLHSPIGVGLPKRYLSDIGYSISVDFDIVDEHIMIDGGIAKCSITPFDIADDTINCHLYSDDLGGAIRLFNELAQMRDDTVENQWFCFDNLIHSYKDGKDEELVKIVYIKSKMKQCVPSYYHRLTPLEVAEAFRDGEIKL